MWKFEHSETTTASAGQLWQQYADPSRWPEWDHETEWVTVNGPFATGTTGVLKPAGGPKTKFRFVEVTEHRSFTDVSMLPLAKMHFAHRIESTSEGSRFTHTVTITGPLSGLFGRVIGRKIAAGLPTAMRTLSALAEAA
ncbi:MAG TPA: polyketide cyclase/dehydrase and lipid transport [Micromonosporaceae bacterium]|nr:polyketide cyclase/dehydrase and lipid transport [Micromonosporaceae bacterium]HCU51386.1 polyketide cyclase/dehydrase and lipid transport [Micromonosporaceae bacterium]